MPFHVRAASRADPRCGYRMDLYALGRVFDQVAESLWGQPPNRIASFIRLVSGADSESSTRSAADLLQSEVFEVERERLRMPSDADPASDQWLKEILALRGQNAAHFTDFPLPSANLLRHTVSWLRTPSPRESRWCWSAP